MERERERGGEGGQTDNNYERGNVEIALHVSASYTANALT